MKKLWLLIFPVLAILIGVAFYIKSNSKVYDFKIHVFDFGKSDASVITYKDKTILIDASYEAYGSDIVNYLNDMNIDSIDYFVVTHYDKDHVGGASYINENIEVKNIIRPDKTEEKEYYDEFINSINENTNDLLIKENTNIKVSDLDIDIYPATKVYDKSMSNNSSLVLNITYGEKKFLFAGDIEKERTLDFLNDNCFDVDFIKIPHHGEYNKSAKKLIECTNPEYAVITSSNKDLESDEVVALLDINDTNVILTRLGDADIKSDGEKIVYSTK